MGQCDALRLTSLPIGFLPLSYPENSNFPFPTPSFTAKLEIIVLHWYFGEWWFQIIGPCYVNPILAGESSAPPGAYEVLHHFIWIRVHDYGFCFSVVFSFYRPVVIILFLPLFGDHEWLPYYLPRNVIFYLAISLPLILFGSRIQSNLTISS